MNKNWTPWRKECYRFLEDELFLQPKDKKILIVGSGPGQFKSLYEKFKHTRTDMQMYEGIKENDVIDFCSKDGVPYRDYDIVILSNVLEHARDPYTMIKNINSSLKQDGIIIGMVPFLIGEHQRPNDFFRYTRYGLINILKESGFGSIQIVFYGTVNDLISTYIGELEKINNGIIFRLLIRILYKIMSVMKRFLSINNPPNIYHGMFFKCKKEK